MRNQWRRFALVLSFVLPLLAWTTGGTAQENGGGAGAEPGSLWLLNTYRVPGCEPMPRVPTVFNWLVRKALAVSEFLATSADCGQIGRRGAREGWTYVFWMEREDTAVGKLVRNARERYSLTQLVPRRAGQSWTQRAEAYEPFVLVQLPGERWPARVWASGHGKLEVTLSVVGEEQFEFEARSVTYDGKRCTAKLSLVEGQPPGPRKALPCRPSG